MVEVCVMRRKLFLVWFLTFAAVCNGQQFLSVKGRNLTLNGEKVFLSGMNQAWVHYGADFGNGDYNKTKATFMQTLDVIHKSGGNSIRVWVHVDGGQTPQFNSSGYVTGLDPYIIGDLRDFLHQAQQRNVFVVFTLWNCAVLSPDYRTYGMFFSEAKTKSYVDNALRPMVRALKNERALAMWEIMNEPEGCIAIQHKDPEPCYDSTSLHVWDFSDWTERYVPLENVLKFMSVQSSAIHTEDPKALVTVGAWTYKSVTNQLNRRNFYSDECMKKASGGADNAKLDLYQIHTYDMLIIYLPHDPFLNNASLYAFDKPVIIGEFSHKAGGGLTSVQQFTWAYYRGYNGAWSWCAKGGDAFSDNITTQERGMQSLKDKNDQTKGGRVNININMEDLSLMESMWYSLMNFFNLIRTFFLVL